MIVAAVDERDVGPPDPGLLPAVGEPHPPLLRIHFELKPGTLGPRDGSRDVPPPLRFETEPLQPAQRSNGSGSQRPRLDPRATSLAHATLPRPREHATQSVRG